MFFQLIILSTIRLIEEGAEVEINRAYLFLDQVRLSLPNYLLHSHVITVHRSAEAPS
jgi:hypothetical protein